MSKKEMSKEEMVKMLEELQNENENLQNENENLKSGEGVKSKVLNLIESGVNSIEELSNKLSISSKNVSSNLTYLRNDLKSEGKTIISMRIDGKSMLSIKTFSEMGW